jgi:hypothetical protein
MSNVQLSIILNETYYQYAQLNSNYIAVKSAVIQTGQNITSIVLLATKTCLLSIRSASNQTSYSLVMNDNEVAKLQGSSTDVILGELQANSLYVLRFSSPLTFMQGQEVFRMSLYQQSNTRAYFSNGILPVFNSTQSLYYTFDSQGNVSFIFDKYSLYQNQVLPLATLDNALQSGSVLVNVSDQTIYGNKEFEFIPGEFISIKIVPLKSEQYFTGVINVSIPETLQTQLLNVDAISVLPI